MKINTAAMSHSFGNIPGPQIQRSQFDRSHGHKTTFNEADLVPIYVDEALPGDTFNLRTSAIVRVATPAQPLMDNLYVDFFFFAVPNRLLWTNWKKFCGEQVDPGDSTDYLVPTTTVTPSTTQPVTDYTALAGYMGIPYGQGAVTANALHFRAYNLIFNEWFRDENLTDSVTVPTGDGPDTFSGTYSLLKRCKRRDYFSSCLPWPQKGDSVSLPLGTTADIVSDGDGIPLFGWNSTTGHYIKTSGVNQYANWETNPGGAYNVVWDDPKLITDLTTATAASINDLRTAFQIQRLLERDARGGTRYTEVIRSHFGVVSPDARMQRPEYLGGGSAPIVITPVEAHQGSVYGPQGKLTAYGAAHTTGHGFVKSFTEHCVIIGLANVRADLTYQNGLDRMWSRQTRYDYYWPSLSHLGEQAVLNKEIYWSATPATDDAAFGYQERYAEYRYKNSRVSGIMHSNVQSPLDSWHLALDFATLPVLNDTFIKDAPPVSRIVAVTTEPHFTADFWFTLKCARPMPTFSIPGMIDHF